MSEPQSMTPEAVAVGVISRLADFVEARGLGLVEECAYQLPRLQKKEVRRPFGSFVARGRFPGEVPPRVAAKLAPDLAIETASTLPFAEELDRRVSELLDAGTALIWVIYARSRIVYVFRADGTIARLTEGDTLSGEGVIPGFSLLLATLFASTSLPPTP